jgi:hypothetical protein
VLSLKFQAEKNPEKRGLSKNNSNQRLGSLDIGSLLAFWALRDFELNFLTFFEGLESVHVDCGKVSEQIFTTIIWSDKAETFRIVEPLNCTCCHNASFK